MGFVGGAIFPVLVDVLVERTVNGNLASLFLDLVSVGKSLVHAEQSKPTAQRLLGDFQGTRIGYFCVAALFVSALVSRSTQPCPTDESFIAEAGRG
jgi:hypothetical protein